MYEIGIIRDDGTTVTRYAPASNIVEAMEPLVDLLVENVVDVASLKAIGIRRLDAIST